MNEGLRAPGTFESTCDEILDTLTTRNEYLRHTLAGTNSRGTRELLKARLDELKIVKMIINTLKTGDDE